MSETLQFNVLSYRDAAKLLRWSLCYAGTFKQRNHAVALEVRRLVRQMMNMILPEDLLMLSHIADQVDFPVLARELRDFALKEQD